MTLKVTLWIKLCMYVCQVKGRVKLLIQNQRICPFCDLNRPEDGFHFYVPILDLYLNYAQLLKEFRTFNRGRQLLKYIKCSWKIRKVEQVKSQCLHKA